MASQDLSPIINLINSRFDELGSQIRELSLATKLYDPKRCHGHTEAIAEARDMAGKALEFIQAREAAEEAEEAAAIHIERRFGTRWQVVGVVAAIVLGLGSLCVAVYSATRPTQAQQVAQQELK